MKRVMLIGNSPLPHENTRSRPAAGLRTFQFLESLRKSGQHFEIGLVTIAMPECYEEKVETKSLKHNDFFSQLQISKDSPKLQAEIQKFHNDFKPDLIISVNTFPSYIASSLNFSAPFWADLNGWIIAEGQAQAYKLGHNDYMQHYCNMETSVLEKADKISVVSEAQKYAVLGELALLGRLGKESFEYEFVHKIPNAAQIFSNEKLNEEGRNKSSGLLQKIPRAGFNVFWLGGYNTWADEETLFEALEMAMEKCENLNFVSTGGKIKGLDDKSFENFKNKIENSKYKNRFHFLGWVETDQIPYICELMNVGINVDRKCVETLTGARNRLNEMMKFGLPIVTTEGSEVAYEVAANGAGLMVENDSPDKIAAAIEETYRDFEIHAGVRLKEMGEKGKIFTEKNSRKVMDEFLEWLENPSKAPTLKAGNITNIFKTLFRYFRENGVKKTLEKIRQKIGLG